MTTVVKTRIAVVSGLVLAVGAWLAPPASQRPLSTPPELAAPLIEQQVQRGTPSPFAAVDAAAAGVRRHTVAIAAAATAVPAEYRSDFAPVPSRTPSTAGLGVLIADSLVLTHVDAVDGRATVPLVTADDTQTAGTVVAYDPLTGLVLLETPARGATGLTWASVIPPAGSLTVAAGRADGRDIAFPIFVTASSATSLTISPMQDAVLPGTPLFTLAGELYGVATPGLNGVVAVPAGDIAGRLAARAGTGERLASIGVGLQTVSPSLAGIFGDGGAVVTDVLDGGPAEIAGLRVGDVIVGVGADAITTADAATGIIGALPLDAPATLLVRRQARELTLDVTPQAAYQVAAIGRRRDIPSRPDARQLLPASLIDAGAIPPGAQVLAINGQAVATRDAATRLLRTARRPVAVLVREDGRSFFVAVSPAS